MADSTIHARMVGGPTALASARAHNLVVDRSPDRGGQDLGFLGGGLLLAGAGGRPPSNGVAAARARDIALRSAPVAVRGTRAGHPPRSSAIGVGVGPDADLAPEGIDTPIPIAGRACIVPATIRAVTPLAVRRTETVGVVATASGRSRRPRPARIDYHVRVFRNPDNCARYGPTARGHAGGCYRPGDTGGCSG